MVLEQSGVGLGQPVPVAEPLSDEQRRQILGDNRALAIQALRDARAGVETIEKELPTATGDDALAGAHCTLRTVANMLRAEVTLLEE